MNSETDWYGYHFFKAWVNDPVEMISQLLSKPGVLPSMGLQRVGHDWVNELTWTEASPGEKSMHGAVMLPSFEYWFFFYYLEEGI